MKKGKILTLSVSAIISAAVIFSAVPMSATAEEISGTDSPESGTIIAEAAKSGKMTASTESGEALDYEVFLPENYEEGRHYPTVYLMPQDGYDGTTYVTDGLEERLKELMAGDEVTDLIVVVPSFEEGDDYNAELSAIVEEVDASYSTIADTSQRGILGVGVGGYMAYENALVENSGLFYAVGSEMGIFTADGNPWYSEDKDVAAAANALEQTQDKGYSTLMNYYFYMDAPNEDSRTTEEGGSSDIGSQLEKLSNPYWQYGSNYYLYSTPDLNLVNFAVLDGNADTSYYIEEIGRALNRFSLQFTRNVMTGTVTVDSKVVNLDTEKINLTVAITYGDTASFSEETPETTITASLIDPDTGEILAEEEQTYDGGNLTFTFSRDQIAEGTKTDVSITANAYSLTREIAAEELVRVQESGSEPEAQLIDLMGSWYFDAYKEYGENNKTTAELDKIDGITSDIYRSWEEVLPALDWWTADFAESLGGQDNFAGYAWYVREFDVPEDFATEDLVFSAGKFDEANEVYINGTLIGSTGMDYTIEEGVGVYDGSNPWETSCVYDLDSSLLNYGGTNVVAVRMCNSTGGGGWYEGPVGIYTTTSYAAATGGASRLQAETYESASTGNTESYRIYLPADYEKETDRTYPVLYLLHGINSSSSAFEIDGIDQVLDRAIEDGELEDIIVVMPDDPTKTSFWTGVYADMITEDLIPEIDSKYRTIDDADHRYIAGCSMGGAGSVGIGLVNSDLFSGIISFYGAFEYVGGVETASAMTTEELSSFKIYMACGNCDMYNFYIAQEELSEILTEKGVEHYHYVNDGKHESAFYLPLFVDAVAYITAE